MPACLLVPHRLLAIDEAFRNLKGISLSAIFNKEKSGSKPTALLAYCLDVPLAPPAHPLAASTYMAKLSSRGSSTTAMRAVRDSSTEIEGGTLQDSV